MVCKDDTGYIMLLKSAEFKTMILVFTTSPCYRCAFWRADICVTSYITRRWRSAEAAVLSFTFLRWTDPTPPASSPSPYASPFCLCWHRLTTATLPPLSFTRVRLNAAVLSTFRRASSWSPLLSNSLFDSRCLLNHRHCVSFKVGN